MPTISTFYGILIQMFWKDHAPPHFHALYAEDEALIDIRTLDVIEGQLTRRALALVLEWAQEHRAELLEDGSYVPTISLRKRSVLSHNPSHPPADAVARSRSATTCRLQIARPIRRRAGRDSGYGRTHPFIHCGCFCPTCRPLPIRSGLYRTWRGDLARRDRPGTGCDVRRDQDSRKLGARLIGPDASSLRKPTLLILRP